MSPSRRFALVREIAEAVAAVLLPAIAHASRDGWLYGASAAGEHLGWPTARVHRWIGRLPHYRAGGRLMFKRSELDAWVEAQREEPPGATGRPGRDRHLLRDRGIRGLEP